MATNKPPADDLLTRAADLRAAGKSWEATAAALGYSAQTVRKWPIRYSTRWRRVHGEAERREMQTECERQISTARGKRASGNNQRTPLVLRQCFGWLVGWRLLPVDLN